MNKFKKLVVLVGIGLGSMGVLSGCNEVEDIEDKNDIIEEERENNNLENSIEKGIVKIIQGNGVNIYYFNLTDAAAIEVDHNYYLVFGGEMIETLEDGFQQSSISFKINKENYEIAKNIYNKDVNHTTNPYGGRPQYENGNLFWRKYSKDTLNDIRAILNDKNTTLNSVKNMVTNELIYSEKTETITSYEPTR